MGEGIGEVSVGGHIFLLEIEKKRVRNKLYSSNFGVGPFYMKKKN
jgi:hypothetical protein